MHGTVCKCQPRVSACIFRAVTSRSSLHSVLSRGLRISTGLGGVFVETPLLPTYTGRTQQATSHESTGYIYSMEHWRPQSIDTERYSFGSDFNLRTSRDLICASKVFLGVTAVKADSLNVGLGPIISREGCSCRIQLVPTEMLHTVSDLTLDWRVDINLQTVEM